SATCAADAGDARLQPKIAAGKHRLCCERERCRERTEDPLVRNLERTVRTRPELWLELVQLVHLHTANVRVPVLLGLLDDPGESRKLLGAPCYEQGADACERNAHLRRVLGQQRVPAGDEPRLERSRLRVEARMQQRR